MNTDTHPDTDALKAYLLNSESPDYATLRLHLAGCPACRDEAVVLSSLINNYASLDETRGNDESLSDEQHQLIIDYIDGKLSADESVTAKTLINDNKYAMKSALHYTSHRSAMADSLPAHTQDNGQSVTGNAHHHDTSRLSQMLSTVAQWLDTRAPVWAVPATAFTVAIAIFSIQSIDTLPFSDANNQFVVASYQDNPVMQFRPTDALPGIGFFSKADNISREYNGVLVKVLNNDDDTAGKIKLQWPRVKNAIQYSMRLQVFNQGQKITLGEISTKAAIATFDVEEISNNKRYEWILTGETTNKKTFYSTGGFIISKAQ